MENKQYDLFLTRLDNPEYDAGAMQIAGITSDNTSLRDASDYKNRKDVQSNPMFHTPSGNFDESKFNKFYNESKQIYNYLANSDRDTLLLEQIKYDKSNIYAPVDKKKLEPTFEVIKMDNPFRQKSSMSVLGKLDDRTQSISEIAQQEKLLLNPIEVENGAAPIWDEAPEEGNFFKKMIDTKTKVLAIYDDDVFDNEGNKIHSKGDLKLNDNGVPYYEALEGRSVYGRQVLNKMDILTKEDSKLNKYDFFDSDDIKKSVGGTLLKNTVLIGSLFIPYVGKALTLASILNSSVGLFGTLGKMLTGSDTKISPFLSEMEGWAQQTSKNTVSEYAQQNTWCWENFINLIGSVANQLIEQRFIFDYAPMIKYGKYGATKEGQEEFIKKELTKLNTKSALDENGLKLLALQNSNAIKANAALEAYMKDYHQAGKIIGQTYMTLITTLDTYGEAKANNASDVEATALTLGYAAAEYALLNTDVGQWIMPELKQDKLKNKAIAEALASDTKKNVFDKYKNVSEKTNTKKWFNKGKEIAQKVYKDLGTGGKTVSATLAAASAEAVEEVSEELLADLSKSCFNLVGLLRGDETRMEAFQDIPTRYTMSFLGGFVGGGIANLKNNYLLTRDLNSITSNSAMHELIYMIRNGESSKFLEDLNKASLGSKNLSAKERDENGYWKQGTEEDNQDKALKSLITNQINDIKKILNAEGLDITDDSFLDIQTRNDLRLRTLQASTISSKYLQEFNSLSTEIVAITEKIQALHDSIPDEEKRKNEGILTPTDQEISKLTDRLNKLRLKKEDLLTGKFSGEFMKEALFELNTSISNRFIPATLSMFVYQQTGRELNDLSEEELKEYTEIYNNWTSSEKKDDITIGASVYNTLIEKLSGALTQQAEEFKVSSKGILKGENATLSSIYGVQTGNIANEQVNINATDVPAELEKAKQAFSSETDNLLKHLIGLYGSDNQKNKLKDLVIQTHEKGLKMGVALKNYLSSYTQITSMEGEIDEDDVNHKAYILNNLLQGFLKNNYYVNPEIKIGLLKIFDTFYNTADPYLQEKKNIDNLFKSIKELKEKPNTPIVDNLMQVIKIISGNPELEKTLTKIDDLLTSNEKDFSNINASNYLNNIEEILKIIDIYDVVLDGVRVDNIGAGNLWGYAKTINELNPDQPQLALIDGDFANLVKQDLLLVKNKLEFVRDVHRLNQGRKLNTNNRVSLNFKYITYNKLSSFIENLPTGWVDNEKLQSIINGSENLKKYSKERDFGVNNEIQKELEKEFLNIQNAIYDYFQVNKDRDFSEILENENLNLFVKGNELLTEDAEYIDDNSFVWFLASRASIKAESFYKEYKNVINNIGNNQNSNKKNIAPLPTQELPVYLGYARIANGYFFSKFVNSYRKTIKEQWKKCNSNDRLEKLIDLDTNRDTRENKKAKLIGLNEDKYVDNVFNLINIPTFKNMVLVEGIAGSGKSTAVGRFIKEMLEQNHPELLKNVALVHASESGVKDLFKNMNLDRGTTTLYNNKQEFLPTIISEYKEATKNNDGLYEFSDNQIYVNDENEYKGKFTLNDTSKVPSIIFLDEVTLYTKFELEAIDAYARKHGIIVITFGDYDQPGATGRHKITYGKEDFVGTVESNRLNFIRSPKLGVSMRSANTQVTANEHAIQAFINNDNLHNLTLHYYQSKDGIYGDKIYYDRNNDQDGSKAFSNLNKTSILADIDLMLSTAEKKENGELVHKIGYIYNDENSWLYQVLQDSKYKDKIDFKFGISAQGLEGDYFIVDLNQSLMSKGSSGDANTNLLRIINTCATRKKKGNIFIAKETDLNQFLGEENKLINVVDNDTVLEQLSNEEIINFSKKRLDILNELIDDSISDVEFFEEVKEELSQNSKQPENKLENDTSKSSIEINGKTFEVNSTITLEGIEYIITNISADNSITLIDNKANLQLFIYEDFVKILDKISDVKNSDKNKNQVLIGGDLSTQEDRDKVDNSSENEEVTFDPNILQTILYSFNTFEFGIPVIKQGNTYIIDIDKYNERGNTYNEKRIDSLNGLYKLFPNLETNELIQILGELRSAVYLAGNKGDLENKIKNIFSDKNFNFNEIYCTFALKSSAINNGNNKIWDTQENVDKYAQYHTNENDKVYYTNSNDTRSLEARNRKLVLLIGDKSNNKSKDILEIPLFTLNNPYSLLNRKVNGNLIYEKYLNYWNDNYDSNKNNQVNIIKDLINFIESEGDQGNKELLNYLKTYLYTDNNVFYIQDNEWVPNKNLENLGIQYSNEKGINQLSEGFSYSNEWKDISEYDFPPGITHSTKGYVARTEQDNLIVGHPFILVSYDSTLNTDTDLENAFIEQLKDPTLQKTVKPIYIIPPKASFREYIEYLKDSSSGNIIGNDLTAYKLWKTFLKKEDIVTRLNAVKETQSDNPYKLIQNILEFIDSKRNAIKTNTALEEDRNIKAILNTSVQRALEGIDLKQYHLNDTIKNASINAILKNWLKDICCKHVNGLSNEVTQELDTDRIEYFSNVLDEEGVDGIYRASITDINNPNRAQLDFITINDIREYKIHTKVDSPIFIGDLNFLFQSVVDYIENPDNFIKNSKMPKMNGRYIQKNSNLSQSTLSKEEQFVNKLFNKIDLSDDVKNKIKEFLDTNIGNITYETFVNNIAIEITKSNVPYFAIYDGKEFKVSSKNDFFSKIKDIINDDSGKLYFIVEGKKYLVTISENEIKIKDVEDNSSNNENTVTIDTLNDINEANKIYNDIIEKFKDKPKPLARFKNTCTSEGNLKGIKVFCSENQFSDITKEIESFLNTNTNENSCTSDSIVSLNIV